MSDKPLDCVGVEPNRSEIGKHDFKLNAAAVKNIGAHLDELAAVTKEHDAPKRVLRRLMDAKNEKDANGDTPKYRRLQDGAWEEARETLRKLASGELRK